MTRLTHDEIIRVLGGVNDSRVAAVMATEASLEELEKAAEWVVDDCELTRGKRQQLTGAVAQLYEILTADEAFGDEREA